MGNNDTGFTSVQEATRDKIKAIIKKECTCPTCGRSERTLFRCVEHEGIFNDTNTFHIDYECSVCGEQWEGGTFNEDLSPAQDYKEVEEKDTELVQGIIVAVVYLILCAILGDDIWSRLGFIALNFLVTCIFSFAALLDEKSKHLAHLCGIGLIVQIVAGYYIVI